MATKCIYTLAENDDIREVLKKTPVSEIWGVGRAYAEKLVNWGITSAWELSNMREEWAYKNLGGVVSTRLIGELKGTPCIEMKNELVTKKMIATTGIFGRNVTRIEETIQSKLFAPAAQNNKRFLMNTLDNINFSMRDDVVKFAASGINTDWKMRKEFRSPRYTSRWKELRKVN